MLPKVSVCLPTYKQGHLIEQTINSVLAQKYPCIEIVVGDDGSNDGTAGILQRYKGSYPGLFRLIVSEENTGVTANCNRILKDCSGDYIAFIAGDDLWNEGKLFRQVEWFGKNPDAAICHTKTEIFDSSTGKTIAVVPRSEAKNEPESLGDFLKAPPNCVSSSLMVARWALPEGGFDKRVPHVSDWLFILDVLAKGRMGYIDEVLTRYRKDPKSISSNDTLFFTDQMFACDLAERKYSQYKNSIDKVRIDCVLNYLKRKKLDRQFAVFFIKNRIRFF